MHLAGKTGLEPAYSNYSINAELEAPWDTCPLKALYLKVDTTFMLTVDQNLGYNYTCHESG